MKTQSLSRRTGERGTFFYQPASQGPVRPRCPRNIVEALNG